MDELWRFKKADFTLTTDKFKQDWYNRARPSKANPNMTLREIEYHANVAVFTDETYAMYATGDLYENDYAKSYTTGDKDKGLVEDVPKGRRKGRPGKGKGRHKIKTKRVFNFGSLRQSRLDDESEEEYAESWLLPDYNSECCKSKETVVSDHWLVPDRPLNLKLYGKLREISEESAVLRMIVAWYIYVNGYVCLLTEAQAEFWETDFSLLDMMEAGGECQVQWLLSYTNIDTAAFYKHRAYLREQLSGFFEEIVGSNA